MLDPEDPLTQIIKGRNKLATEAEVAVLLHSWWAQYGLSLQALGAIAHKALTTLEAGDANEARWVFLEAILVDGTESPSVWVLTALPELDQLISDQTDIATPTKQGLRELFAYLIKLGRIKPV